jgi:hypothetical protein
MALRGDEEIDSLLSIMGGGDGSTSNVPAESRSTHKDAKKKKKRSKKRRLECDDADGKTAKNRCISFAESRLAQNCFHWPQSENGHHHLSLGAGLAHDCKEYMMDSSVDACRYGSICCKNCGRSSSAHELRISFGSEPCNKDDGASTMQLASIIVAARNARCVMGEYHVPMPASESKQNISLLPPVNSIQSTSKLVSKRLDLFTGRVLAELKNMHTQIHDATSKGRLNANRTSISPDDFMILKEKMASMTKSISEYKKAITTPCSDDKVTNQRIEAMAMCDIVYYRCY